MSKKKKQASSKELRVAKRAYVSQTDIPKSTLAESLRLAQSLLEDFAGKSAAPHQLAMSVGLSPTSSTFHDLCGASIAYGLTEGGAEAHSISLTDLGRRIVAPTEEGDDQIARVEAVTRPRVLGEFFRHYNRAKFPSERIAPNVLVGMGVPRERASSVLDIVKRNGELAGIIHQTKTGPYVALEQVGPTRGEGETSVEEITASKERPPSKLIEKTNAAAPDADVSVRKPNNRVYVSHGKDRSITQQIKDILTFGKFEPVVSIERESLAVPVPDKVFEEMRSCAAGVIHVSSEGELLDTQGKKVRRLNENVLIEIGAARAFYGKNFVLLVEKAVELPSNLQGLYRCEYEGDTLDYEATMKLLKTFNEFDIG